MLAAAGNVAAATRPLAIVRVGIGGGTQVAVGVAAAHESDHHIVSAASPRQNKKKRRRRDNAKARAAANGRGQLTRAQLYTLFASEATGWLRIAGWLRPLQVSCIFACLCVCTPIVCVCVCVCVCLLAHMLFFVCVFVGAHVCVSVCVCLLARMFVVVCICLLAASTGIADRQSLLLCSREGSSGGTHVAGRC